MTVAVSGDQHALSEVVMQKLEDAVARGRDKLDYEVPAWAGKVGKSSIVMMDPDGCMLHRLFGSYKDGLAELCMTRATAASFGFDLPPNLKIGPAARIEAYKYLGRLWTHEVRTRLEAVLFGQPSQVAFQSL